MVEATEPEPRNWTILSFAREHGSLEIGRIMLVTGVAQLITAPIAVELERRIDGRLLMAGGFALFALGVLRYCSSGSFVIASIAS